MLYPIETKERKLEKSEEVEMISRLYQVKKEDTRLNNVATHILLFYLMIIIAK